MDFVGEIFEMRIAAQPASGKKVGDDDGDAGATSAESRSRRAVIRGLHCRLFFLRAAAKRKLHHQGENERLPNVAHDLPLSPTHGQGVYVGSSGLSSTGQAIATSLLAYAGGGGVVVQVVARPVVNVTS